MSAQQAASSVSLFSSYKRLLVPWGFSIKWELNTLTFSVYNTSIRAALACPEITGLGS